MKKIPFYFLFCIFGCCGILLSNSFVALYKLKTPSAVALGVKFYSLKRVARLFLKENGFLRNAYFARKGMMNE